MKMHFSETPIPAQISPEDWVDWRWQMRKALRDAADFARSPALANLRTPEEKAFEELNFSVRSTPYYAQLATRCDAIAKIVLPSAAEKIAGAQQQEDPLGEKRHMPTPRIVHRYPDRVLFLLTDTCSVYCRYCTRKHFTGRDHALIKQDEYEAALKYLRAHRGVREVILSGGDPLTLADAQLERVLGDLRRIDHLEILRIGTRMPVVCPMRITEDLVRILQKHNPVFVLTHFNHPKELTAESAQALARLVDHGLPTLNQMVLLNGVNNHAAIVQALSRRLLYLRVKPYYMFQCDPSPGTDHLRTSLQSSREIQRELWGRLSGLALPNLSVDIPSGGGKAGVVPPFEVERHARGSRFIGWDGVECDYLDPATAMKEPADVGDYLAEWQSLVCEQPAYPPVASNPSHHNLEG